MKSSGIAGDPLPHKPTPQGLLRAADHPELFGKRLRWPCPHSHQAAAAGRGWMVSESRKAMLIYPDVEAGSLSPSLGGTPNHKPHLNEAAHFAPGKQKVSGPGGIVFRDEQQKKSKSKAECSGTHL